MTHPPPRSRLRLEFAPAARRVPLAGVAALALSLSLLIAVAAQWALAWAGNARQTRALAEAGDRPMAAPAPRAARADPAELARVQLVRETARSLATPWADLLGALESAPTTVALLSVEPSAAKRGLSLTAEAADAKGMLDYLRALQGDSRLSDVVLVSHQVQAQAPGTPVRFQVQAHWGGSP